MPAIKKARAIRRGAVVGIAAPAGPIDAERIEAGEALLRRLGFEPLRRADLGDRLGYLAGDDPRRAGELMELLDDAKVEAIVCARGGYGSARILARLLYRRGDVRRRAFRRFAHVLTEVMARVITGEKSYRQLLFQPLNYVRLLRVVGAGRATKR